MEAAKIDYKRKEIHYMLAYIKNYQKERAQIRIVINQNSFL